MPYLITIEFDKEYAQLRYFLPEYNSVADSAKSNIYCVYTHLKLGKNLSWTQDVNKECPALCNE